MPQKAHQRDWYVRNRERLIAAATDRYNGLSPEERSEISRRKRLARYGLKESDYQALLDQQGGVCAICGAPPVGRRLAVDHDHVTGEVRGLLCQACNTAIGKMKDSPDLLRKAAFYLEGE